MSEKRVNPETGVLEEKRRSGWVASTNSEGHEERINPETGVREEKRWSGWAPSTNSGGREERINPETGVLEETRWSVWTSNPPGAPDEPRTALALLREQQKAVHVYNLLVSAFSSIAVIAGAIIATGSIIETFDFWPFLRSIIDNNSGLIMLVIGISGGVLSFKSINGKFAKIAGDARQIGKEGR